MYAGGISYVSECSLGLIGLVSAGVAAIEAMDRSKIEMALVDMVEHFIRWKWFGALKWLKRARLLISEY